LTPPSSGTISPSRRAAFSVLREVGATSAHSDDLLHSAALQGLSVADRGLATTLVLGTLRWQIALDARIRTLLLRPDDKLAEPVAIALRMGAFQLLHLDRIPAHAAISESVELAKLGGQPHAAGMVNALLRKVSTAAPVRTPLYETPAAMAERLGHPGWMVGRWVKNFGRSAAVAICEHDQAEPPEPELFAPLPVLARETGDGEGGEASPVRMDDGSRLVAELAAAAKPGAKRIWDCCAAPGGKTLVLLSRHPEAEFLATDVSGRRLQAMERRLERDAPGARVRALKADATALPEDEGKFDLILCDVPCSGTGTLARNPEIRHRLQPEELARQAARQREILAGALRRLAPGGRLVYSTCSLEPEENEAVVEAALAGALGIAQVDAGPVVEGLAADGVLTGPVDGVVREGRVRTLPGANFRGDGFFAVVLERVG
jgi:16S rRNA (cytosine967-C5)-methyltransferase